VDRRVSSRRRETKRFNEGDTKDVGHINK